MAINQSRPMVGSPNRLRQREVVPSSDMLGQRVKLMTLVRPTWLTKDVYPFPVKALEISERTIALTDVGEGPTILFVHTGFWSFIWRDVINLLRSDFRCISFDSPGTGLSTRTPNGVVSLESASLVAHKVIEALDLRDFTLAVHDLGGPVGLGAIAASPDRVRGIAAINAFAWKPSTIGLSFMLSIVGSSIVREFDVLTNLVPRITMTGFGIGQHMDQKSRDVFRKGIGRSGVRAFHNYLKDAKDCEDLYQTIANAVEGPLGRLPLLTIFGERNDPFGFQQHWRELYPDARQLIIPRGNHFPMCDDPQFVANSLRSWHRERVVPMSEATSKI